jgi:hypothetical protein
MRKTTFYPPIANFESITLVTQSRPWQVQSRSFIPIRSFKASERLGLAGAFLIISFNPFSRSQFVDQSDFIFHKTLQSIHIFVYKSLTETHLFKPRVTNTSFRQCSIQNHSLLLNHETLIHLKQNHYQLSHKHQ